MMRLILNAINGRYLREIPDNAERDTEYVEAAVAYAAGEPLLFNWCLEKGIPLRFWGRFDETLPVSLSILRNFLQRRDPNFTCKLLTHFHAKVIWWHGVGAYVGSANFTDPAWYGNIEAGCFFDEAELIASAMDVQLRAFFLCIDRVASPLTAELYKAMEDRAAELKELRGKDRDAKTQFMATPSLKQWNGLLHVSARSASDSQRKAFLDEWHRTLQILRDIGIVASSEKHRPPWIPPDVSSGAQADQFLHAYYYSHVVGEDRRSHFEEMFEENRLNPARALNDAMIWWHELKVPPSSETKMLLEWAPFLRDALAPDTLLTLSGEQFSAICHRVWSIQDHARRMPNVILNLPGDRKYSVLEKTDALAQFLFSRRSQNGASVLQVIYHVLYDGAQGDVPARLWEAISDSAWRIEHLGISALGELVGWALPDIFPPRNNRTSKSLRALGFSVEVHG
jgi:hypothetical protein